MSSLTDVAVSDPTPCSVWAAVDAETRRVAARALFSRSWDDEDSKLEAHNAIARALRFRDTAVRRLPLDKRVDYLLRAVRPSQSLATALLMALHLVERRDLLAAFLTSLDIPHEQGVIHPDHEFADLAVEPLAQAVNTVRSRFDGAQVDLYLATLLAIDPASWGSLVEVLRRS